MLLTLRGTPFLYYGEEIGMRNVPVPAGAAPGSARLHAAPEPVARSLAHADAVGARARARASRRGEPWLPIGADAELRNVAAQRSDPGSLLHLYRELLALRRAHAGAPRAARYAARARAEGRLRLRAHATARSARVVALNFGDAPAVVSLGRGRVAEAIHTRAGAALPERLGRVELGPCEGIVVVLA